MTQGRVDDAGPVQVDAVVAGLLYPLVLDEVPTASLESASEA